MCSSTQPVGGEDRKISSSKLTWATEEDAGSKQEEGEGREKEREEEERKGKFEKQHMY